MSEDTEDNRNMLSFSYGINSDYDGIVNVKKALNIFIHNKFQRFPIQGVVTYLISKRLTFMPELNGLLLGWEIDKIKERKVDSHFNEKLEFQIKGTYRVLVLESGDRLPATIVEVRNELIIAEVFNIFAAEIKFKPTDEISGVCGEQIEFKYKRIKDEGDLVILIGKKPKSLSSLSYEEVGNNAVYASAAEQATDDEHTADEHTADEQTDDEQTADEHQKQSNKPASQNNRQGCKSRTEIKPTEQTNDEHLRQGNDTAQTNEAEHLEQDKITEQTDDQNKRGKAQTDIQKRRSKSPTDVEKRLSKPTQSKSSKKKENLGSEADQSTKNYAIFENKGAGGSKSIKRLLVNSTEPLSKRSKTEKTLSKPAEATESESKLKKGELPPGWTKVTKNKHITYMSPDGITYNNMGLEKSLLCDRISKKLPPGWKEIKKSTKGGSRVFKSPDGIIFTTLAKVVDSICAKKKGSVKTKSDIDIGEIKEGNITPATDDIAPNLDYIAPITDKIVPLTDNVAPLTDKISLLPDKVISSKDKIKAANKQTLKMPSKITNDQLSKIAVAMNNTPRGKMVKKYLKEHMLAVKPELKIPRTEAFDLAIMKVIEQRDNQSGPNKFSVIMTDQRDNQSGPTKASMKKTEDFDSASVKIKDKRDNQSGPIKSFVMKTDQRENQSGPAKSSVMKTCQRENQSDPTKSSLMKTCQRDNQSDPTKSSMLKADQRDNQSGSTKSPVNKTEDIDSAGVKIKEQRDNQSGPKRSAMIRTEEYESASVNIQDERDTSSGPTRSAVMIRDEDFDTAIKKILGQRDNQSGPISSSMMQSYKDERMTDEIQEPAKDKSKIKTNKEKKISIEMKTKEKCGTKEVKSATDKVKQKKGSKTKVIEATASVENKLPTPILKRMNVTSDAESTFLGYCLSQKNQTDNQVHTASTPLVGIKSPGSINYKQSRLLITKLNANYEAKKNVGKKSTKKAANKENINPVDNLELSAIHHPESPDVQRKQNSALHHKKSTPNHKEPTDNYHIKSTPNHKEPTANYHLKSTPNHLTESTPNHHKESSANHYKESSHDISMSEAQKNPFSDSFEEEYADMFIEEEFNNNENLPMAKEGFNDTVDFDNANIEKLDPNNSTIVFNAKNNSLNNSLINELEIAEPTASQASYTTDDEIIPATQQILIKRKSLDTQQNQSKRKSLARSCCK